MRALPGTPVGGLFPPRLPSAIGEGQPHMAEQFLWYEHVDMLSSTPALAKDWEENPYSIRMPSRSALTATMI